MTYVIKKANGDDISVPNEAVERTYSSAMVGENTLSFGNAVAQTVFQQLENYASDIQPDLNVFVNYDSTSPTTLHTSVVGQLWYDTANLTLKIYDPTLAVGLNQTSDWVPVASSLGEFGSNVIPAVDQVYNIGSDSRNWHYLYANHGVFRTSQTGNDHSTDTVEALIVEGDALYSKGTIKPDAGAVVDVGETANPFAGVYLTTLSFGTLGTAILELDGDDVSIKPQATDSSVNLGTNTNKFGTGYLLTVDAENISSATTGTITVKNILAPDLNDTHDIGSDSFQFSSVYATSFVENGTLLDAKYVSLDDESSITLNNNTSLRFESAAGPSQLVRGITVDSTDKVQIGESTNALNLRATTVTINDEPLVTSTSNGSTVLINDASLLLTAANGVTTSNGIKMDTSDVVQVGSTTASLELNATDNDLSELLWNGNPIMWAILDQTYPVGSMYENYETSLNPKTLLNWSASEWTAVGEGRVTVGVGTGTDANGDAVVFADAEEGGEYTHTLTIPEIPAHTHGISLSKNATNNNRNTAVSWDGTANIFTGPEGGGEAHTNTQPYVTVYRWRRIA